MDKKSLSERDICTKYITPALVASKWNTNSQVREEVTFTLGRIHVKGKLASRGKQKRADYILYYKTNISLAVIEAKDNNHSIGAGTQQALDYAVCLDIPLAYSSNGNGFLEHNRTISKSVVEGEVALSGFPSPEELWERYLRWKAISKEIEPMITQDYYYDPIGKSPRYYQQVAINRAIDAIGKGQNRILLVMATGTGKTYVAFQIIWRLWKGRVKKRILYLADRNIIVDQTMINDL